VIIKRGRLLFVKNMETEKAQGMNSSQGVYNAGFAKFCTLTNKCSDYIIRI